MVIHIVFDYDGVLVDSYSGVEAFYRIDLRRILNIDEALVDYLLYLEYLGEAIGWLREDWWPIHIPNLTEDLYDVLITRYWERRIENQKPLPGVKPLLEKMKRMGFKLHSVSYRDDIYGLKRYRIELEEFTQILDKVIIAGEDVKDRAEGLRAVLEEAGGEPVVYVDDKPLNLYKLWLVFGDQITLVHHAFTGKHYNYPWINPGKLFKTINNLHELLWIVKP